MATLMETIQKNMQQAASPDAMAKQGQQAADTSTSQAQQLQQATTGKAGGGMGAQPRASQVAANVAAGQAAQGAAQLQQQATLQGEAQMQQAEAQKQQLDFSMRQLDENQLRMHDSFANQATQIANEIARNREQVGFKYNQAQMEQLGFTARLANEKYVSQLQQEAERARLTDDASFQEEYYGTLFKDQQDILAGDMAFQVALNGKNNEWKEYLASIDIDHVLDIADISAKAAGEAQMYAGGTKIIESGYQMAAMASGNPAAATASNKTSTSMYTSTSNPTSNVSGLSRYEKQMGEP